MSDPWATVSGRLEPQTKNSPLLSQLGFERRREEDTFCALALCTEVAAQQGRDAICFLPGLKALIGSLGLSIERSGSGYG